MPTMPPPPNLLNADGSASMATALMLSHHAFRRDISRFSKALPGLDPSDSERLTLLRREWQWFRGALHGHHQSEDNGVFPHLRREHPEVAATIDRLTSEHHQIDPLLERGDTAFGEAFDLESARDVSTSLAALLTAHLAVEEAEVVPFLREAKQFPSPSTDQEAAMYAQGFGWASYGIAPDVLTQLDVMLPDALRERMPAARAEFAARFERVWGSGMPAQSTTPIPG